MGKLVYGLNQSLDGYVDHDRFGAPSPALFRHYVEHVRGVAGMVYGRKLYELMQYWDDDRAEWGDDERAYAAAWRSKTKWVVSRTLASVGPNARRVSGDELEATMRRLKADVDGEFDVAGPEIAHALGELGLIDEYRLYLLPVAIGHGKPYFAGPRPALRFVRSEVICEDVVRLTYVPR